MELAATIGMSITEFYEITPYELSIAVRGFYKRKEIEAKEYQEKAKHLKNLLTIQAYEISCWVWKRPSKIQLIKMLEDKTEEHKIMTESEMLEQVKALNQMFGGDIVYVSKQ